MNEPLGSPLHRRLAAALGRIQIVTAAAGRRAADAAKLSPLQMAILQTLTRLPGQRGSELARHLEVTPGTISVAVSTLETKKLIRKSQDPNEHRAWLIDLTAKGRRVAAGLDDWADASLLPLVEDLGDGDAGQVLAGLLTVLRAAEERGLIDATHMCLFCRHFLPWSGKSDKRPHRCDLLRKDIAAADLQVDCPDFADAEPEERIRRAGVLERGS